MNRQQRRAAAAKARKTGPGYLQRMRAALPTTPGLSHVHVSHDSWCAHFSGGACDCFPTIHMREEGSDVVRTVGPDGAVIETLQRN